MILAYSTKNCYKVFEIIYKKMVAILIQICYNSK